MAPVLAGKCTNWRFRHTTHTEIQNGEKVVVGHEVEVLELIPVEDTAPAYEESPAYRLSIFVKGRSLSAKRSGLKLVAEVLALGLKADAFITNLLDGSRMLCAAAPT